jgi:ketosteroid isomerase-like protein
MSNANVSLIQSLYAAFGRGDIAPIIAALTPDVDWTVSGRREDYPLFGSRKGPGAVQEFFRELAALQDFSEFTPREFYTAGDRVFVLGRYAATVKKTGRKAACPWCHIFSFRGDKVGAFLEFTDTAQWTAAYKG